LIQGHLAEGERLIEEGLERLQTGVLEYASRVSGLPHSAMVSYYNGRFVAASAELREDIARTHRAAMRYSRFAFADIVSLAFIELHQGNYRASTGQGREILSRAQESGDLQMAGAGKMLFGALALAQGAYADAHHDLVQAVVEMRHPFVAPVIAFPGHLQVLATLAYAEWFTGEDAQAKEHLTEVLRRGTEVQDYLGILTALPAVALLVVDDGQAERGLELYALASSHGYVANSVWFEDVAGKNIAAVAAPLPPDVVATAQERGQARDLWETAEELLEEFNHLK
jgi:hypothetical protein